jgi:hypothetical protein
MFKKLSCIMFSMKSSLLHVGIVFIIKHNPYGTSNCWYPPSSLDEKHYPSIFGKN